MNSMFAFFKKLISKIKHYLQVLAEIMVLTVVEKLSKLIVFVFSSLIALLFISFGILFSSFALAMYLNDLLENKYYGLLIVAAIYFVLAYVIFKLRNFIFSKFVIKQVIKNFEK